MSQDVVNDWNRAGKHGVNAFMGWGLSTLLLWLCRRWMGGTGESEPEPSKFTYDNVNAIGSTIPVVIGRGMIKSPLVSYYGDYDYKKYFEEYGAHSKLNVWPMIVATLINLIVSIVVPDIVVTNSGGGKTVDAGAKRRAIIMAVVNILVWLLMNLINKHLLKTTIQKGFKYYLGWQNIICWTGDNIGIKKVYMNVYDDKIEDSIETGVWDNNNHIAWKQDNLKGIVAHIDNDQMFGGPDEGGGFVGDIRIYFGTTQQGHDSWMVKQMTDNAQVDSDLKGLTPIYPMYFTCVIPKAYIGKQPNIPEMWFEIVNYPNKLWDNHENRLISSYIKDLDKAHQDLKDYVANQAPTVKQLVQPYAADLSAKINALKSAIPQYDNNKQNYENKLKDAQDSWKAYDKIYPDKASGEFDRVAKPLSDLLNNGVYMLGRLGDDENPAGAIYEILKNTYWGCNYPDTRIDIDSLIELGKTCELEKLGVSMVLNNTDTASSFISKILTHINGVCYDSPTTGMLTFKLIRNDYNVDSNDILELNTTNCESMEFTRLDWSETISAINVNFVDAENKYDTSTVIIQDRANTFITDDYKEQDVDGSYFTTAQNARTLAQTQLLSAGYPLATIQAVTNRIGYDVTIGDPIRVNWEPYGIIKQAFRVTDIDYGSLTDESIKITAVEDVFGFGKVDYDYHGVISWEDKPETPENVKNKLIMEMPYEVTLSLDTYIYAYANRPSKETRSWLVYKYDNHHTKVNARTSTFSMIAKLNGEYPLSYLQDSQGIEISADGVGSSEQFNNVCDRIDEDNDTYNNRSSQNIIMIDNEIMSYNKMELMPNGSYRLTGIIRGIYDTLPERHTPMSTVYFLTTGVNVNGQKYACGMGDITDDKYEIRTASANSEQDFVLGLADEIKTTRRSECPSIMANLKFGMDKGQYTEYKYVHEYTSQQQFSNNLLFKFNPRHKYDSYGILAQDETNSQIHMTKDIFNTITVKGYNSDLEVVKDVSLDVNTNTNKTSMIMKWSDFCKKVGDANLKQHSDIELVIRTYNQIKNLYSYANYTTNIQYNAPVLGGVFTDMQSLQTFADSAVNTKIQGNYSMVLPDSVVCEEQAYMFDDCVLLAIGTQSTTGKIKAQDGFMYDVQNIMYRICGLDNNTNKALIEPVTIDDGYRFASRYTQHLNNYTIGYKYTDSKGFEQVDFV